MGVVTIANRPRMRLVRRERISGGPGRTLSPRVAYRGDSLCPHTMRKPLPCSRRLALARNISMFARQLAIMLAIC
jgi:hypothetical protein